MELLIFIIKLLYVPFVSPLCIGIIRKIKAIMQNRQGASISQPYFDLIKLFQKDEAISPTSSWIFLYTPYILFTCSLIIATGLPFLSFGANVFGVHDFLVIIYLLALGSFFLSLAGVDTASSFGGFGSSREMTVVALTEGGLLFSLLPIAFIAKTTNVANMATAVSSLPFIDLTPVVIAFVGFFIALLAENSRIPVDNPSTHLELTMIHEAMILEYSGKRLALVEWAAFNKLTFFAILGAGIFFPWGVSDGLGSLVIITAKVFLVMVVIALIESTIAKLRFFRLPDMLFTSFILGIISLFLVIF